MPTKTYMHVTNTISIIFDCVVLREKIFLSKKNFKAWILEILNVNLIKIIGQYAASFEKIIKNL